VGAGSACVGVLDYRAGNIRSIVNAFEHLGAQTRLVSHESHFSGLSHVVLPGVGAFGFCAERLRDSGLLPALQRWTLDDQRPLLGICVGMQILADSSDELGLQQGLGWGGGKVERLHPSPPATRVPHVGWNSVSFDAAFGDFAAGDEADFYFDHSYAYAMPTRAQRLAACTHGQTFSAVIRHGNLVAAQFHPEKSQTAGMRFLRGFLAVTDHA
jgi:imidazole glycerol-phosphate synthase subunit HisH